MTYNYTVTENSDDSMSLYVHNPESGALLYKYTYHCQIDQYALYYLTEDIVALMDNRDISEWTDNESIPGTNMEISGKALIEGFGDDFLVVHDDYGIYAMYLLDYIEQELQAKRAAKSGYPPELVTQK